MVTAAARERTPPKTRLGIYIRDVPARGGVSRRPRSVSLATHGSIVCNALRVWPRRASLVSRYDTDYKDGRDGGDGDGRGVVAGPPGRREHPGSQARGPRRRPRRESV